VSQRFGFVGVAGGFLMGWLSRPWFGLCLLFCLGVPAASFAAGPVGVVVSVLPEKYFVQRVGGDHVQITVLVGPGRDPHTYEPTPRQVALLGQARIYFGIGMPFEQAWIPRIERADPGLRVVDLISELPPVGPEAGQPEEGGRAELDPHTWTSPLLVKAMAEKIREALARLDPSHAAEYAANAAAFLRDLDSLDQSIRKRLAPYRGQAFMVFHPAWGYFARTYGLREIAIESEGKEPGPRSLASLIERAKAEHIGTIFVQPQLSERSADIVAQAIGAKVIPLDPLAEDYLANMRLVARRIAQSLSKP
jgi:zinc transport system substrate-binding protein